MCVLKLLVLPFICIANTGAVEPRRYDGNLHCYSQPDSGNMGEFGIDTAHLVSVDTLKSFKANGTSFVIFRGYRSLGKVDEKGIQSVKNAAAAGFKDVDIYIFPQVKGEKTPNEQIREMLAAFNGTQYGRVWLDIEEPNRKQGEYWFPPDKQGSLVKNQLFFHGLLEECVKLKVDVGVYSDKTSWNMIMGEDFKGGSSCPLWYARWDHKATFDGFQPFGGWEEPFMKQIEGDVIFNGTYVDRNWRK